MDENGCIRRPSKTAGATVYLMEELGDARMRCDQLVRYVDEAVKLLENAPKDEKEALFESAGHLVQAIPGTLFKLQKALQAVALAATRMDYEELKDELKPEKVEQLEKVLQDVRLRHVKRRSQPWSPREAAAMKSFAEQASLLLGDLVEMEQRVMSDDRWKMSHDWSPHLSQEDLRLASPEQVREKFKKENPSLSDEDLDGIVGQWMKNKDVVKDKSAAAKLDKAKVRRWMQQNLKSHIDRKTDEANTTALAEEAAAALKLYDGDDIPEEVFEIAQEVAEKAGHGVRLAAKRPTFDQAKKTLLDHLDKEGWKLSSPTLKVPHATSRDGTIRLWFKTQAVYLTQNGSPRFPHELGDARSIHVDIRDLTPEQFMAKVTQWTKEASVPRTASAWKVGSDEEKQSKFQQGKPADPTENMSPEDAAKWKEEHDKHKDNFKSAAAPSADRLKGAIESIEKACKDIKHHLGKGKEMPEEDVVQLLNSIRSTSATMLRRMGKTASDEEKSSKFEEGKPADPTENMDADDAAKWKEEHDKNKDRFKNASRWKA